MTAVKIRNKLVRRLASDFRRLNVMSETYLNPVYHGSAPDPFVLKYCGEYWAYCTGVWHDGRCFGVLHSRDLVHWRALAGAMDPLPDSPPHYWAPEVAYDNGRFLMYYSVGDEEHMHIRVATAEHPAGPFVDSGRRLTSEVFAIDAHVFVDDDGARYLFYATDFLDHGQIGTGTVCARLRDPFTIELPPRPVTLPRYDWHVYDPRRVEKGGVRWHTVEGPSVLKRKGRYYQMFSGGNWRNTSYGVSYATSDSILAAAEWTQIADGERVLPILRTIAGRVIGPGHNSVVRGPDNQQLFCVYHRWSNDLAERRLAIDPLDWAGERLLVLGPSTEAQPAPLRPAIAAFFDAERVGDLGPGWECAGGRWAVRAGAAIQQLATDAHALCDAGAPCFVAEVSLRGAAEAGVAGSFGVGLYGEQGALLRCLLAPGQSHAELTWRGAAGWSEQRIALPDGFDPLAYHLLRLEVDRLRVSVALDTVTLGRQARLAAAPSQIGLLTQGMSAAFAGFALTIGWEDAFAEPAQSPASLGWRSQCDGWELRDQQLWQASVQEHALIVKEAPLAAYTLVVNARLAGEQSIGGCYGFYPAMRPDDRGPLLTVERHGTGWALICRAPAEMRALPLPDGFDPTSYQQFRFRKQAGRLMIAWEAHFLGELEVHAQPAYVGLYADRAVVAFDMVRVTAITV